jgi:hypothetical protein
MNESRADICVQVAASDAETVDTHHFLLSLAVFGMISNLLVCENELYTEIVFFGNIVL